MAQAAMTVRMDQNVKSQFEELCDQFGMSINTAFNIFVHAVVNSRRIPFEICEGKDIARKEARRAFMAIREEVALRNEPELSLSEINAEIKASRLERKNHK